MRSSCLRWRTGVSVARWKRMMPFWKMPTYYREQPSPCDAFVYQIAVAHSRSGKAFDSFFDIDPRPKRFAEVLYPWGCEPYAYQPPKERSENHFHYRLCCIWAPPPVRFLRPRPKPVTGSSRSRVFGPPTTPIPALTPFEKGFLDKGSF